MQLNTLFDMDSTVGFNEIPTKPITLAY